MDDDATGDIPKRVDNQDVPSRAPRRWILLLVVPMALVAALVIWSGTEPDAPDDQGVALTVTSSMDVTTVGLAAAPSLPICENAVEQAVLGFFTAMANGDAADAEAFFATDDFDGYTELPHRTDNDARNRDTLLGYLEARTTEGAQFHLVSHSYHGGTGDRLANFGVDVRNEEGKTISGQGAVNCQTSKIIVLYLAPLVE